jgi:hypothetical protein
MWRCDVACGAVRLRPCLIRFPHSAVVTTSSRPPTAYMCCNSTLTSRIEQIHLPGSPISSPDSLHRHKPSPTSTASSSYRQSEAFQVIIPLPHHKDQPEVSLSVRKTDPGLIKLAQNKHLLSLILRAVVDTPPYSSSRTTLINDVLHQGALSRFGADSHLRNVGIGSWFTRDSHEDSDSPPRSS